MLYFLTLQEINCKHIGLVVISNVKQLRGSEIIRNSILHRIKFCLVIPIGSKEVVIALKIVLLEIFGESLAKLRH
jgi:hypothetical protein